MTTFVPRPPYTREELDRLYPKKLQLQLVQIVSPSPLCEDRDALRSSAAN